MIRHETSGANPGTAWTVLDVDSDPWPLFDDRYGFWPDSSGLGRPAITEPDDSVTFDLSSVPGPGYEAVVEVINAEAMRCFVTALSADVEMYVVDYQHQSWLFRPSLQVRSSSPSWPVTVYPDGDYYGFFTQDFSEGTFGHPWQKTLCVIGPRMLDSLAAVLRVWLPVRRLGGRPV